jgi:hypothetical protein
MTQDAFSRTISPEATDQDILDAYQFLRHLLLGQSGKDAVVTLTVSVKEHEQKATG